MGMTLPIGRNPQYLTGAILLSVHGVPILEQRH